MIFVFLAANSSFIFSHTVRYIGVADGLQRLGIDGKPFRLSEQLSPCTTVDLK